MATEWAWPTHDWGRLPRPDKIQVQPGNHRIVISMQGYRDFVTNVIVPAGQVVEIPIQLDLMHGTLRYAQYHPNAGWLTGHGFSANLEKSRGSANQGGQERK